MEKAFTKEFIDYLKESGVEPKVIAKIQYDKLKAFVINKLRQITDYVECEDFHRATLDTNSVICDECDNTCSEHYIDFGYCDRDYSCDFDDVIGHLRELKEEIDSLD